MRGLGHLKFGLGGNLLYSLASERNGGMITMRTSSFFVVIVAGLVLGISGVSQADTIQFQAGASLANMIWQQSPPAFAASTAWSDLGFAAVINGVSLDVGVMFWDFHTMQISDPPSFVFNASTEVERWSGAGIEVVGGATLTPNPLWLGLRIGGRLRTALYPNLLVSSGVFLAGTQGASGFPGGWALGVTLGISWSWPLPISLDM